MCCFSGPVRSVSSTRIFSRLTEKGSQFIAYQMKYRSDEPNAMILPLPTMPKADEDAVRFIDLSKYDSFFKDLNRGFPKPVTRSLLPQASRGAFNEMADSPLAVHKVGNFEASFVPSMDDFDRLDERFVIPKSSWEKIPQYKDWGFAVFQLHELAGEPHAMAFEFATRFRDSVFFPTVHIHDGEVHSREGFDHTLYAQHPGLDAVAGDYTFRKDPATNLVRSKGKASDFVNVDKSQGIVAGSLLVHRRTMTGIFDNKDIWVASRPSGSRQKYGAVKSLAPLGMLLPLGWIIHRRNLQRKNRFDQA